MVAKTQTLRVGIDGTQPTDIGSLTNVNQLRIVAEQIDDALAKGALGLTGGKRIASLPGYFIEPKVLVGLSDSMRVMQVETPGPVLPIIVVRDEAEAIHDNLYRDNGRHPADPNTPGGDLAWDGTDSGWQETPGFNTSSAELPRQSALDRAIFPPVETK